jgi:uncharacterized iron-regulated membrane protein
VTIKKAIGKVHLWLGLTSGLVVFVISITGCLYAFQSELQELTQPFRRVDKKDLPLLPPSELEAIAIKELPGKKIHSAAYEKGGDRAVVVSFYDFDPLYYYLVYINPYDGRVLKVKNMTNDFFYQVLQGHFYLWLPAEIGQPVVATATLVFVVMLISGLVLWWPKKNKAKQRFMIKWNAKWRRKNYDLHNVLGFYTTWIALILALTGLVWGFEWFANSVYQIAGGDKILYEEQPSFKVSDNIVENPLDKLWIKLKNENPNVDILEMHFPTSDTTSLAVTMNPDSKTYWKADYRFFDQYTLEEIPSKQIYGKFSEASAADKLIRMNYDIHTGAIFGLPGKILAFFASLICASLPVTGFYIWYGRKYKRKEKKESTPPITRLNRKMERAEINS